LANIEQLVYIRMQHSFTKIITPDRLRVGVVDRETWRLLAQKLLRSKTTYFSKRSKNVQDGILFRKSSIQNHGFDKISCFTQRMHWNESTGFPDLIPNNWHFKKYGSPSGSIYRIVIKNFTLIYRE